ncbi:hypothetical protein [Scytonema hofmannii]|nr:hypothetical protein [Scytonema hofmannii]
MPLRVIASKDNSNTNNEIEALQIEITQQDIKNIDELVTIAERNSAQIQETKAAMGLSSFNDLMTLELSTSTDNSFISDEELSITVTIDPIKIFTATKQLSVVKTRWNEEKRLKRVAVVQSYVDYLQARQASIIAAYQMQKLTGDLRVASLHPQTNPRRTINHIANPDFVAAVTEMLNTNTRERVALEQLAACVGLSPQATTTIIDKR